MQCSSISTNVLAEECEESVFSGNLATSSESPPGEKKSLTSTTNISRVLHQLLPGLSPEIQDSILNLSREYKG